MEIENALQTITGSDSSSNAKSRKKETQIEYLTDHIECKSVMINNIDNCHLFAMPKKGIIRLTRDQTKRAFFLELFLQKEKRVTSIEVHTHTHTTQSQYIYIYFICFLICC